MNEPSELAAGWCWAKLTDLAQVWSGQTPKGIEEKTTSDGEIPWFKVGDMNHDGNERYMHSARKWLSSGDAASMQMRIFPAGSIIFPKRGGAIATNKKRLLAVPGCCDLNTMVVATSTELASYLWWWFATVNLSTLSDGSNVPQINHHD